jgi:hypothetical protein
MHNLEKLFGSAVSTLWRAIAEVQQRRSVIGWVTKIYYLELLRASVGTSNRWSRLHLQSLSPINTNWARMVGYGGVSLCIIHKEDLCPCSGDINRLMMMMNLHNIVKKHSSITTHVRSRGRPMVIYNNSILSRVVSDAEQRIAPLPFFHGCRKR